MATCSGRREVIRYLRQCGCNEAEIALHLGVTKAGVKRVLADRARNFRDQFKYEVRDRRQRGETYAAIAIALGIGEGTAWKLARAA